MPQKKLSASVEHELKNLQITLSFLRVRGFVLGSLEGRIVLVNEEARKQEIADSTDEGRKADTSRYTIPL